MKPTGHIITGACIDMLPTLDDHSIAACITSPPYAMQRKEQYGGITEAQYPAWTVEWMRALRPKLTADGSVLIVIRPHLKNGQISDYVLRTRLALREDGWHECEELIWLKTDAPPLGSILRPRRTWESILWFSMSRNPYVDLKACGSASSRVGGFFGSTRFRGGQDMPVHGGQKRTLKKGVSRISDVFSAPVSNIDRGVPHPAMYPRSLTDRLVKTFSRPDDTILDVFCGSGTTCLSAVNNGRHTVGIERNNQYARIASERIAEARADGNQEQLAA